MAESHEFGAIAEDLASNFLESQGYCILHRNWTFGHKELDIVCTDGKMLIVVEVKARSRSFFPHPDDLLSKAKEKHIIDACEQYLFQHGVRLPVRFDLLSVTRKGEEMDIEHYKDAFFPEVE